MNITQEKLKELLNYDPNIGIFTWKKTNKIAGSLDQGYVRIRINKKLYRAHALAVLFSYGHFPKTQVDHINGIRNDNRINNLRECSNNENCQNKTKPYKNNLTSNLLGCCFEKSRNKFKSEIMINGKKIFIGRFKTAIEAHQAYINKKREIHVFNTL